MHTRDYDAGSPRLEVIAVPSIPEVRPGDDLAGLIVDAARRAQIGILDRDIIVVAQKVVSKSEGRIVRLADVMPSEFSRNLARKLGKAPEEVEVILRESRSIVRSRRGILVTETLQGQVMANSGVDRSNVADGYLVLLPSDPDGSARRIRNRVMELTGVHVAVIISDTMGRPIREGQVDVAIGASGIRLIRDYRGKVDDHGRELKVTQIAQVDELASAAELVMGKARMVPAVIIRGYIYEEMDEPASALVMPEEKDMFR